jgi:hypothetical protein
MEVRARARIHQTWERLSLPQRLSIVPYLLVGIAMAAPWSRGEAFMSGFWGSEPTMVVQYGFEAMAPVGIAAALGLAALLTIETDRVRSWSQIGAWLLVGFPALTWFEWTGILCFMCSNVEILWGATLYRSTAFLGLAIALVDLAKTEDPDWRPD